MQIHAISPHVAVAPAWRWRRPVTAMPEPAMPPWRHFVGSVWSRNGLGVHTQLTYSETTYTICDEGD